MFKLIPSRGWVPLVLVASWLQATPAEAESVGIGRYTPTQPGSASFWVDDPTYHQRFTLGAALTLDYAHDPLVLGVRSASGFAESGSLISHQMFGHAQLAASFARRMVLGVSLPVGLWEDGRPRFGIRPADGLTTGDIRVSSLIRLVGDAQVDAYSAHLGLGAWLPTAGEAHNGDASVRLQARLLFAGRVEAFRWGFAGGFLYRDKAALGNLPAAPGNTVGSELDFAARAGVATADDGFTVAPEIGLASALPDGRYLQRSYTSLEASLGAHARLGDAFMFSVAPGLGFLKQPGTPDFRMLVRLAWAPRYAPSPPPQEEPAAVQSTVPPPPDGDGDGIVDGDDACPAVKGVAHEDRAKHGCPPDGDDDGVLDGEDVCPSEPKGANPDPARIGCPLVDTDADGVWDPEDVCVKEPMGALPDPQRRGCPLLDRDGDTVGDDVDACPDKAGAPHPDPKRNGCPGLVEVREGKLVILKPVFFATNKDKVLAKSFPVLEAVADALKAQPQVRKVRVEGHTDDRGNVEKNTDLSQRRAESVRQFLISRGVEESRLEATGYGPSEPIETNKTSKGRAANRRVEFDIVERKETP